MTTNLPRWDGPAPAAQSTRVWLAVIACEGAEPADAPTVRDDLMRTWRPEPGAMYRSGRCCIPWAELRARFDLVEVAPTRS